jgi:hypothetical protein
MPTAYISQKPIQYAHVVTQHTRSAHLVTDTLVVSASSGLYGNTCSMATQLFRRGAHTVIRALHTVDTIPATSTHTPCNTPTKLLTFL